MSGPKKKGRVKEMELVVDALKGDQTAWETLYNTHKPQVMALLKRLTKGDISHAEDLCQDTFLSVYTRLWQYKGQSGLGTWIYRIGVNVFLMGLRKKRHQTVSLDEVLQSSDAEVESTLSYKQTLSYTDKTLESTPERLTLHAAIEALPAGYKKHFIMHDVEGLEHKQIAKKTRLTEGCSKSQLTKARAKLREAMGSKAKRGKGARRGGI